ncbi:hypothetical protein HPB48_000621 [Haemaphysalis longicornis]|uniref:Sushi domain-containing protein n=1 Tax=Haemaphysalis longicornis TaxID=44386 RepID=A0A9J6FT16_HAELO|nr:hypothetical protein HPB48_000621 [Haemaphysalis longicornis]
MANGQRKTSTYQKKPQLTPPCLELVGVTNLSYNNRTKTRKSQANRILGTDRTLGSTVEVTCSRGFELRGPAIRTCHSAAQWTPSKAPVCVPSVCPEPKPGPHTLLSYSNTALGSQVGFSCQDGYVLQGSDTAVCGWGRLWAPSLPACIPVDCGPPPPLENGEATTVSGTTYQGVAKYSCRRGFRIVGAGQRTCAANGTWTDDYALQCTVVTFGSIVEYRCDPWFELHGHQQRSCQADGTWSDSAPRCLPTSCAIQRTMEHGRIHSTPSFSLFSCDPGFRLTGRKALRCLANGTWSGALPECVPKNCSLDGLLPNGRLIEDDATGETARAACDPRYRLRGLERWTCLPDGSWKGPGKTECWLAECPPPDPPINGVVSGTDFNISSVVFYHCNPGYNLTGPQQRTCRDTGLWDGDVPTCEPVEGCGDGAGVTAARNCPSSSCPAPPQPPHGRVVYDRLTIGGVSAYSCYPGFRLSGPPSRLCGRDGRWEGREPTAPEHARVVYTGFTLGHNASYSCEDGYSPRGDPTSVCQPDGTWRQRGGKFECLRDLCPALKIPAHGHVTLEGAWVGARAHYACDSGYALRGDVNRVCNGDGSWSGVEASCDDVP